MSAEPGLIHWYPGHMAAAMRRIGEYLQLIDVVIEVVDARVARSGANPMLDAMAANRQRLLVLTRADLADPHVTRAWIAHYERQRPTLAIDARNQRSFASVAAQLRRLCSHVRGTARAMVVGVPNSGKSCVINGLLRRAAAKTEDRAGVTRSLQWFRVGKGLELMDTPGILVPKISSAEARWKLALVGTVPRERYDAESVVEAFHAWLVRPPAGSTAIPTLQAFAAERGFLRPGGEADYHNAANTYIKEFNDGTFGRVSLESP